MQHDQVIWEIINNGFCSYKAKVGKEQTFCRNKYNITGHCNRQACPLANSRYATIREHEGDCFLYLKTIERAHSPRNLWEKIKLPKNYQKALAIVTEQLQYHSKFQQHRTKQRLTKIHQYLIRMRKLRMRLRDRPKLVAINKKVERREKTRETKALKAANIERTIQQELLERLKSGTYGDIYNFPSLQYENALEQAEAAYEGKAGVEMEAEDEEDEEAEAELDMAEANGGLVEFVAADDDEDEDDEDDDGGYGFGDEEDLEDAYDDMPTLEEGSEDASDDEEDEGADADEDGDADAGSDARDDAHETRRKGSGDVEEPSSGRSLKRPARARKAAKRPKKRRGPYVEIEYEREEEDERQLAQA